MQTTSADQGLSWPRGGGETGRLLREKDWATTPLGPIDAWSRSLRTAVEIVLNSPAPIVMLWGADGVMVYNDAYSEFAGARHPQLFGSKVLEGWPEVADFNRRVMETGLRGETLSFRDQPLVLHRNGRPEEVWLDLDYSPLFDDAGRPAGVLAIVAETTQRVLAERQQTAMLAQAQASAATLQQWFEQAPGFIALLRGPRFVFEIANAAYYQLVGHRRLVGQPAFEALPEMRDQGFETLLNGVLQTGQPYVGHAMRLQVQREADGPLTETLIDFVYQPVFDADGSVGGIFVQGHDVTEQVNAAEALRRADRTKDEFLATLAHELRNPLAPIRTAAHLLRQPGLTEERIAFCSGLIERQSKTMALLLDDLMDVSRIASGKVELRKAPVRLGAVVEAALETARPAIDAKGHAFTVAMPDAATLLEVDPLRIAQALTNLLTNAAKYTDAGGTIRLDVAVDAPWLRFDVVDSGIGIAAEALPTLFEMFHQVEGAADRAGGGLGIGLALSRALVEMHGGRIEAFSEGPGRGSTFRLSLPLGTAVAVVPTPSADPAAAAAVSPAGRKIVVVADDNVDAAEALGLVLEFEGYAVHIAHDGMDALALIERLRPFAAFLDIGMPGLDGHAVAARVRGQGWGRDVLLVATTGWGQDDDRRRGAEAGFDEHLIKPVEIDEAVRLLAARGAATA